MLPENLADITNCAAEPRKYCYCEFHTTCSLNSDKYIYSLYKVGYVTS